MKGCIVSKQATTVTLASILICCTLIFSSSASNAVDDIARLEVLHSPSFDMDFEHKDPLDNWSIIGDHSNTVIDTQTFFEGKQALLLSTEHSTVAFPQSTLSQTLYTSFERDFISLSGYVRFENMSNKGTFNIFLATYDENNQHAASKYIEYKVSSNSDWHEFSVTLPISQEVSYVNLGGVLEGHGKVWLDDLTISFPQTHSRSQHSL